MDQKIYGKVFKTIRKQSGISLAAFSALKIGKATISDFERGRTMMSFDKVMNALQFMGVSLKDFEHLLNDYSTNDSLVILQRTEKALISGNKEELKQLEILTRKPNYTQINFSIKILLGEAGEFEREELTDFLYTATSWTYKEMVVYYILIDQISPRDIINILKELRKRAGGVYYSSEYRRVLALVLFRAITTLSYYGYKKEASDIIDSVEVYHLANSMILRNLFYGTKAYWTYIFEDKTKGKEMMQKFIEILELAGDPEVAQFYKKRSEQYMFDKD